MKQPIRQNENINSESGTDDYTVERLNECKIKAKKKHKIIIIMTRFYCAVHNSGKIVIKIKMMKQKRTVNEISNLFCVLFLNLV